MIPDSDILNASVLIVDDQEANVLLLFGGGGPNALPV